MMSSRLTLNISFACNLKYEKKPVKFFGMSTPFLTPLPSFCVSNSFFSLSWYLDIPMTAAPLQRLPFSLFFYVMPHSGGLQLFLYVMPHGGGALIVVGGCQASIGVSSIRARLSRNMLSDAEQRTYVQCLTSGIVTSTRALAGARRSRTMPRYAQCAQTLPTSSASSMQSSARSRYGRSGDAVPAQSAPMQKANAETVMPAIGGEYTVKPKRHETMQSSTGAVHAVSARAMQPPTPSPSDGSATHCAAARCAESDSSPSLPVQEHEMTPAVNATASIAANISLVLLYLCSSFHIVCPHPFARDFLFGHARITEL